MPMPKPFKTIAAIGMATVALGVLTACGSTDQTTYARVCEDKSTQTRVADTQCSQDASAQATDESFIWYYLIMSNANSSANFSAPAVGSRLSSGTTAEPEDGEEIDENLPEEGGEITGDEDGITQEQAPESDEDENDSGSISEDEGDEDSFSGGFSEDE